MSTSIQTEIEGLAKDRLTSRPQSIPTVQNAVSWNYRGKAIELPASADSLEGERGLAAFEAMDNEPYWSGPVFVLRALVLASGYVLTTSHNEPGKTATRKERSDYKRSEEIRQYMERAVNRLETELLTRVDIMVGEGRCDGHKLFEKVRAAVQDDDGTTQIQTVALKPKPRGAYRFVVTRNMDVLGVVPGSGGLLQYWDTLTEDENKAFVPFEDLLVYTFNPKDDNPLGRGVKRIGYDAWYRKQLTKPESLTHVSLFGSGRVSVEAPAPTSDYTAPTTVTVAGQELDLADYVGSHVLPYLKQGSATYLPNGLTLKVHDPAGNGEAFEKVFDRCDREMTVAVLTVTRATSEAQHGSKADSQTAEGLLAQLVNSLRSQVCALIREHYFIPDLALKYGESDARRYAPKMVMEEAKEEDVVALLQALPAAVQAGVVTPEQLPGWDKRIGQVERDLNENAKDPAQNGAQGQETANTSDQGGTQNDFSGPTFKAGTQNPQRIFTRAYNKATSRLDSVSKALQAKLANIEADTGLSQSEKDDQREKAFDAWENDSFDAIAKAHRKAAEAGVRLAGQATTLTQSQKDRIAEVLSGQGEFLADFREKYELGERTDAQASAQIQAYALRARGTANEMFVAASPDGSEFTWTLGAAEHCPDCPSLAAGSPYTADTLLTYPGAGDTACLIQCRCILTRSDGVSGFARPGETASS